MKNGSITLLNNRLKRQLGSAGLCLLSLFSWQVSAAWYEAQGQALIVDGNKTQARQKATAEALRQALLFAGASVQSVQTLTNGLLSNESLQVSASGEVNEVELVNERWHDEYVTVTVRADIFATPVQCGSAGWPKALATTFFPIQHPQQAQDGQLQKLSSQTAATLQTVLQQQTSSLSLRYIAPYAARWWDTGVLEQAPALARQGRAQYTLAAIITDLSVERPDHSRFAIWKDDTATRQFALQVAVIDGMNNAQVFSHRYQGSAPWEFDRFAQIDVASESFWRSQYGQMISETLAQIGQDLSENLACQPLTGRVLKVNGEQLDVSIGKAQGIETGDILSLYQTETFTNQYGQEFLKYRLYPTKVKVVEAFANSATVEAEGTGILVNIQPNDFVAKR